MAKLAQGPSVKDRIVQSYARHGVLKIAAAGAGISVATLDRWIEADADFAERLFNAKLQKADQYLRELDTVPDNYQRRWWLATMFPEHFAARSRVELTGANGGPIQVQSLAVVVSANDSARSAYHGLLAAIGGTDRNGESSGSAVGGNARKSDAVAALPAQPRARQRPARRRKAEAT